MVSRLVPHKALRFIDHHTAHATYAFVDSPFTSAVVISADGAGNDGCWHIFYGERLSVQETPQIRKLTENSCKLPLGQGYRELALRVLKGSSSPGIGTPAATLMRSALTGRPRDEWKRNIRQVFAANYCYKRDARNCRKEVNLVQLVAKAAAPLRNVVADSATVSDFAATCQAVMQEVVAQELRNISGPLLQHAEGLVFTGGVAYNSLLVRALEVEFAKPAFVPAAPGDAGLSIGAAYAVRPPQCPELARLGPPLRGVSGLGELGRKRSARQSPDPAALVAALQGGASVGVVRGRLDVGPNPLGSRVRLWLPCNCEPTVTSGVQQILMTASAARRVFDRTVWSPAMHELAKAPPSLAHFGPWVAVGTLTQHQDSFLFALLGTLEKAANVTAVATAPLTLVGKVPSTVEETLSLLDVPITAGGVDLLLIETWLFTRGQ
eukprot:TRINITY_DN21422_c0_g1_i1.p1 TRINITY_DN21422_c0_g1~~TRINITY_DN21422_c0_g1_i1.p1  ORF type:complete len:437 (-),score=46.04 TRINITY_DN21422_c0_g1_i1:4-1314(-)